MGSEYRRKSGSDTWHTVEKWFQFTASVRLIGFGVALSYQVLALASNRFVQECSINPEATEGERFCQDCAKLEFAMYPPDE